VRVRRGLDGRGQAHQLAGVVARDPESPRHAAGGAEEGPCIDAIREHEIFLTGDLGAEQRRWPRFALRATQETGVRSILAIRLFAETTTMGALNMYSTQEDAFTDTDVALAAVFSTHAAVAVASARATPSSNAAWRLEI
jgi:GAF domain-containing protein